MHENYLPIFLPNKKLTALSFTFFRKKNPQK